MKIRILALLLLTALNIQASSIRNADPRSLPSLRIAWTWDGTVCELVLKNDRIFVRNEQTITVINAGNGTVLWQKQLGTADVLGVDKPVVLSHSVAVAFGKNVNLLDSNDGNVLHVIPLSQNVRGLIGPPLIAWLEQENNSELIKIDEASGKIQQRKTLPKIRDIESNNGVIIAEGDVSYERPVPLIGLNQKDLSEIWHLEIQNFAHFANINGKFYVLRYPDKTDVNPEHNENWDYVFAPFNSATGEIGTSLPQRDDSNLSSSDDTWEFQLVDTNDQTGASTIRRNDLKTGRTIWKKTLSCQLNAYLHDSNSLYIHCDSGAGRGYFEVLDWNTGKLIANAYGLRDVQNLIQSGNLLLATSYGNGIVAFSPTEFGPPETTTTSIETEVHRLLNTKDLKQADCWWEDMDSAVKDLEDLGPQALPLITQEIPKLSPSAVGVAARVLADASYAEGASELTARLPELNACSDTGWAQHNPAIAVLRALAKIGSEANVGAIHQVLLDHSRSGEVRREAFASLVSIGSNETPAALDQAIEALTPKPYAWWLPPNPGKYSRRLGTTVDNKEITKAYDQKDYEEGLWLSRAQGSVRVVNHGKEMFIFPCGCLGGQADLWLLETDSSNVTRPAKFLGLSPHGKMIVHEDVRFKAEIQGRSLKILPAAGNPMTVNLDALDVDSDGDALSDIAEERLHTDSKRKDTDGDGLIDSMDLAPNAMQKISNEQQQITAAIFQQFFIFTNNVERDMYLTVMVSDFALEWKGMRGPTITLSKEGDQAFLDEAGYNGVSHITISPASQSREQQGPQRKIKADERLYILSIYRGGLDAAGYNIVVRRLNGKWYIKEIELGWIS